MHPDVTVECWNNTRQRRHHVQSAITEPSLKKALLFYRFHSVSFHHLYLIMMTFNHKEVILKVHISARLSKSLNWKGENK